MSVSYQPLCWRSSEDPAIKQSIIRLRGSVAKETVVLRSWGSENEYHFRVALNLVVKARLSAKFLL